MQVPEDCFLKKVKLKEHLLENYYSFVTNKNKTSKEIVELFKNGDKTSNKIMDIYFERTARSFSSIVNILDPDVIVCGGGMSEIDELYKEVPKRIIPYIASNFFNTPILKSKHGSSIRRTVYTLDTTSMLFALKLRHL